MRPKLTFVEEEMSDLKIKDYSEYGIKDDLSVKESPINDFKYTDNIEFDQAFEDVATRKTSGADSNTGGDIYGRVLTTRSGEEGFYRIELPNGAIALEIATSIGGAGGEVTGASLINFVISPGAAAGGLTLFTIPGYIDPSSDNDGLCDIGSATSQFKTIYLVNAPVVSSDRRFKREIVDLKVGLSQVLSLRPVSYKRLDSEEKRLGFIAQEVREVIPEAVVEGNEGRLGMKYEELVPVLVKAIQELSEKIKKLEKEKEPKMV